MGNKYLIINADDFGRAKSVNESIFNLLKENRISSATLMPNVNYYEQAVNWSIQNSDNIGLFGFVQTAILKINLNTGVYQEVNPLRIMKGICYGIEMNLVRS